MLCPDLPGYKLEQKMVLKNGYSNELNRTSIEIDVIKCFKDCFKDEDVEKLLTQIRFQVIVNKDQINFQRNKIDNEEWLLSRNYVVN